MKSSMILLLLALSPLSATARDTTHYLPIETALEGARSAGKLDGGVKFYFADQAHPDTAKNFGTFTTTKKTNSFGKSDEAACQWAMQSALIQLHTRAVAEGGDAVINIESNYNFQPYANVEKYECHAGAVLAGVALRGTVVKLKQ